MQLCIISALSIIRQPSLTTVSQPRMVGLAPKWVRLAPNGANPGNFQIRFSTFWRGAPKCTESDLKIGEIW